jgi:hypothetical protein
VPLDGVVPVLNDADYESKTEAVKAIFR